VHCQGRAIGGRLSSAVEAVEKVYNSIKLMQ
jgi:hypothetical protein